MNTYIHSTGVIVADQDAAIDFYVNRLGWELTMDGPVGDGMRFVMVKPKGSPTHLSLTHVSNAGAGNTPGGHAGISIGTSDIDATYATLSASGVSFKHPVEVMPWGDKATYFFDPDGNEFFLIEE